QRLELGCSLDADRLRIGNDFGLAILSQVHLAEFTRPFWRKTKLVARGPTTVRRHRQQKGVAGRGACQQGGPGGGGRRGRGSSRSHRSGLWARGRPGRAVAWVLQVEAAHSNLRCTTGALSGGHKNKRYLSLPARAEK